MRPARKIGEIGLHYLKRCCRCSYFVVVGCLRLKMGKTLWTNINSVTAQSWRFCTPRIDDKYCITKSAYSPGNLNAVSSENICHLAATVSENNRNFLCLDLTQEDNTHEHSFRPDYTGGYEWNTCIRLGALNAGSGMMDKISENKEHPRCQHVAATLRCWVARLRATNICNNHIWG